MPQDYGPQEEVSDGLAARKKQRSHHIQRQCGQRASAQVWRGEQLQKEEGRWLMGERLPVGKRSKQQSVTNDQRQIAHCGRREYSSKKVKSGEPCGVEVQLKTV